MGSKKLVATYSMIKGYKYQPSNKWLALAEFIDNSISSWQGKENPDKSLVGLEIRITFDYRDENNLKLTISDNANGMIENEILNAMQPADRKNKKDTHYNQYGVGMKLGIFWYGQDGIVHSKVKGKKEYCVELKTSLMNENAEVEINSKRPDENYVEYESGTTIKIEKIYPERKWKKSDLDDIREALGWRYGKILSKNSRDTSEYNPGMIIKIRELTNDKKANSSNVWCNVEASYHRPFTLNKFVELKSNKDDFNMEKFQNEWQNDVNQLLINNQDNIILKEFCNLLINGKELVSEIDVSFFENKIAKLKFGILSPSSNYARFSGVTTFHIKRAINHCPNTKDNKSSSLLFRKNKSEGSGGDPTYRRLFGEINLTGIENPDQNKSDFQWSYDGKDNLEKVLDDIWKDLKPLLNLMIQWEGLTFTKKLDSDKEKTKVIESSIKVLNTNIFEAKIEPTINDDGDSINMPCYILKEDGKKIWILESLDEDSDLINVQSTEDGIKIYYNAQHKFWKPFINDKTITFEYRGGCVYPLMLLIALCNDYFNRKELTTTLLKENLENMNFEDVVNNVVKAIEAKDE